nr:MAG TPA: hypothetical protein [Caudoviricetes sp.]
MTNVDYTRLAGVCDTPSELGLCAHHGDKCNIAASGSTVPCARLAACRRAFVLRVV